MKASTTKRVLLGLAALVLFTLNGWTLVYLNGSIWTFEPQSIAPGDGTLNEYVVEGAGYFLRANSDFMLFLDKAEMSELNGADFSGLQVNLDNAILNMENARNVYIQLKQKADITPYNPVVIDELARFNYDVFQKKQGLNASIFEQVRGYLENGEVREVYGKIISDTEDILAIANAIKTKIDSGEFPELSSLWNLGQACSHSLLFGQYVARVFYEINVK